MDIQKGRAKRLAELVEEYEPLPECLPDWTKPAFGRFLLVMHATGDGDACRFMICDTLDEAVEHWRLEIDPHQWRRREVVDLDTDDQMAFTIPRKFARIPPGDGSGNG